MAGPVAREDVGYADGQCIPISRRATHEDWSSESYSTLRWFRCPCGHDCDCGCRGGSCAGEGLGDDSALLEDAPRQAERFGHQGEVADLLRGGTDGVCAVSQVVERGLRGAGDRS